MSIVAGKPLQDLQTKKFFHSGLLPFTNSNSLIYKLQFSIKHIYFVFLAKILKQFDMCSSAFFPPFTLHGSLQSWNLLMILHPTITRSNCLLFYNELKLTICAVIRDCSRPQVL